MRSVLMILATAALVSTAACMAPVPVGSNNGSTSTTSTGASAESGATCDDACSHYLDCKGADTAANESTCVSQCKQLGVSDDQLASFVQTDCATAIRIIENPSTNDNGGSSGGGGSTGSSCDGCAWDGSSCIWLSQSNWGPGAYSGAASSCDATCCPGH